MLTALVVAGFLISGSQKCLTFPAYCIFSNVKLKKKLQNKHEILKKTALVASERRSRIYSESSYHFFEIYYSGKLRRYVYIPSFH